MAQTFGAFWYWWWLWFGAVVSDFWRLDMKMQCEYRGVLIDSQFAWKTRKVSPTQQQYSPPTHGVLI
jgi:hypothetical protein